MYTSQETTNSAVSAAPNTKKIGFLFTVHLVKTLSSLSLKVVIAVGSRVLGPIRSQSHIFPIPEESPALCVPQLIRDSKEVLLISYYRLDRISVAVRRVPDSDVCSALATHSIDVHSDKSGVDGFYLTDDLRVLIDDSLNLVRCGPFVAGHPVRLRTPEFLSDEVPDVVGVGLYYQGDYKRPKYQPSCDEVHTPWPQ